MRLGLRLTVRQAENKPTGSPREGELAKSGTGDQPAETQSEEQPIGSQAGDEFAGSQAEEQPAGRHTGNGPPADPAGGEPAYGQAGDGPAEDVADVQAAYGQAGYGLVVHHADDESSAGFAAGVPGSLTEEVPAGETTVPPADAETAVLPVSTGTAMPPPGTETTVLPASTETAALPTGPGTPPAEGAEPVAPTGEGETAPSAAGRRWAWLGLGLGSRISGLWRRGVSGPWQRDVVPLWQRSVGRAWQRSIGRLGLSRLWRPGPGVREAADPGARTLALITAMPAVLLAAWLLPGLVLLLVHQFLPAPAILIAVPVAVTLTILVAREAPGRWPVPDARGPKTRSRAWAAWWGLGGTIAIAAVFAAWQLVENSPQFIVSRDPGAFAQVAYWIAAHGTLPIPGSAAAFGGAHPGLSFASFGFTSHAGSVVPSVTAGLPIVLATGMWAHGITGAAVISPLIGALGVLAVGGLTARLAGPQWAPAGALLLALTVPEIYTSRSAFSDTLAQALLFGGLCLVVDSFCARRHIALASLGGVVIGLTVLAGTGFLLMQLPLIVVCGALLAGRKPQAIPLTAGWLGGLICGVAAGVGLDLPAVSATTPSLLIIGLIAAVLAVLTGAGVVVGLVDPVQRRARKLLDGRPLRWLPEASAALVVLAAIGLAIRPYLPKVRGPMSPYVAALQRLESLPIDPGRLYSETSLYWVIWYLGVPALLLGLIGLAMITRMCVRALITWRDPTGMARAWLLPVAVIGWGLFAVLWLPATVPDQPWASRRLVPLVLPGLVVLAVWVAAWMIGRAHARGARVVAVSAATACFVVALGVPPAAITFGIELSRPASPATRLALSGLAFRTTGGGEVAAVQQLCGAIPPHSSVLLLDEAAARAFAEVIRGTCDVPTGIVAGNSPVTVNAIIGGIQRAGRHPALLATRAAELSQYGAPPREVVNLATQQDEHLLTRPPTATWPVHYTLWMSAPSGSITGA